MWEIFTVRMGYISKTIFANLAFTVFLGQLADLLHILEASGLPSSQNKYIFNGDFVDRGEWGVEVMLILLALFLARPDAVTLNRGNHEDFAICSVYGFQSECLDKYDQRTFALFVEVFKVLPLFATINNSVFVVHGGLFHSPNIDVNDLDSIDRTAFTLEDLPEGGERLEAISKENKKEFTKQVTRDALWSDPVDYEGIHESIRGNFSVTLLPRTLIFYYFSHFLQVLVLDLDQI